MSVIFNFVRKLDANNVLLISSVSASEQLSAFAFKIFGCLILIVL